jgi:hypothetical integral membrane protein (TIGR02206 family)
MNPFQIFSGAHLLVIFLTLIFAVGVSLVGSRQASIASPLNLGIRITLVFLIVGNELLGTGHEVFAGTWSLGTGLPFHLCDLLIFIVPCVLLWPDRFRFWGSVAYFWTFAGTIQGLLTPAFTGNVPSFGFFKFFIAHSVLIIATTYLLVVLRIRPTFRDSWKAFWVTNIWLVSMLVFNWLFKTNYMFLMVKPDRPSLFDWLGPWPYYILSLEGVGILLMLLLAAPFELIRRLRSQG